MLKKILSWRKIETQDTDLMHLTSYELGSKSMDYSTTLIVHPPLTSPIENCWQPPKAYMRKYPHWNNSITKGLIYEGWSNVSQNYINKLIRLMPDCLKAVLASKGKMTGHLKSHVLLIFYVLPVAARLSEFFCPENDWAIP